MDKYINYYAKLGIVNTSSAKEIKLAYYKLSKELHPDIGGDENEFKLLVDAYKILSNEDIKKEYDVRSKYGKNYDERSEIFDFEFKNDAKNYDKDKYNEWKTNEELNIIIFVDDDFNGTVEYERWINCKACHGSGMDGKAKINIGSAANVEYYFDNIEEAEDYINNNLVKDYEIQNISSSQMLIKLDNLRDSGNLSEEEYHENKIKYENGDNFILLKIKNNSKFGLFELSDDCEFCDGQGKWGDIDCLYCFGSGKINGKQCSTCSGLKRVLGKQKLSGIKMKKEDKDHRVDFMGNSSKDIPGKVGHLWLVRKKSG